MRRIDALFEIERSINDKSADERLAVRQRLSAPLVAELELWMRGQRAKLSRSNDIANSCHSLDLTWLCREGLAAACATDWPTNCRANRICAIEQASRIGVQLRRQDLTGEHRVSESSHQSQSRLAQNALPTFERIALGRSGLPLLS